MESGQKLSWESKDRLTLRAASGFGVGLCCAEIERVGARFIGGILDSTPNLSQNFWLFVRCGGRRKPFLDETMRSLLKVSKILARIYFWFALSCEVASRNLFSSDKLLKNLFLYLSRFNFWTDFGWFWAKVNLKIGCQSSINSPRSLLDLYFFKLQRLHCGTQT